MGAYPIDDPMLMDDASGIPSDMLAPMQPAQEEVYAPAVQTDQTFDHQRLIENIQNPNIAADLDDSQLSAFGQKVNREYDIDLSSRAEWEDKTRGWMDLAMQLAKEKTFPWPKSSNVVFPMMTTAAVQFGARAYPAIVQGRNVVKGVVAGPDKGIPQVDQQTGQPMVIPGPDGQPQPQWMVPPGAKKERATRIGEHMSWQLLEEMTEWEEETDKMLVILPIIGCCFRKSRFDTALMINLSMLVLAQNLVIHYHAKSMERAPRLTERIQFYPNEIEEMIRAGLFIEQRYDAGESGSNDDDAPRDFLEQHRWLDLDEDGYAEPYIVTIHKPSSKVSRIISRYDAEGVKIDRSSGRVMQIEPVHSYTKYDFLPNPDNGIYGVGFGQLLGPINESVNTTLNMLFDSGALQTAGGGFIGRGPSMHSGSIKFRLGEWKMINTPGQTLRDSIVPHQHQGPSPVLFQLLGSLIEAGREVASVKDVLSGETAAATMQPTTLMALIEQGLKVFTAIFKRVHRSLEKELDKLYRLNRKYLENQARYKVGDEWKTITPEDYAKGAGVTPVSDPTMVSDMQRMAKAQFLQSYQNDPLCDGVEIRKRIMDAAQIEDVDKIVHGNMPPNPQIIAETAKLELEGHKAEAEIASERVKQLKDYAQTILYLAQADKINGEAPLEWTAQYIDAMRMRMDSLKEPAEGQRRLPPAPEPEEFMPPPPMPALGGFGQ